MKPVVEDYSQRILSIDDLRFVPPNLPLEQVRQLALQHYGVEGEFSPLAGERDQNQRIRAIDGRQFVFKISGNSEPDDVVEMQVQALCHIALQDPGLPVPRIISAIDGNMICQAHFEGSNHALRMLSWLPGQLYQDGPFPSPQGLRDVGRFIARLGKALHDFEHPATRHFMPWNMANGLVFSEQLKGLMPSEMNSCLPAWFKRLKSIVYPQLDTLRWQVIHQDAHGGNLLRRAESGEAIAGVIDFGDMVYGPLVCDLAACVSDFMLTAADPVMAAIEMCRGFHDLVPLQDEELDVLLDMVMVRQIMTLQLFEFRRLNMENPPAFVTDEQPEFIAILHKLARVDRAGFTQKLKEAVRNA